MDVDKDLINKYKKKLEESFNPDTKVKDFENVESRSYTQFKQDILPKHLSWYEKGCQISSKIIKIPPSKDKGDVIQKAIDVVHLQTDPSGVYAFAILFPLLIGFVGGFLGFVIPTLFGDPTFFFVFFFIILTCIMMFLLSRIPYYMAKKWRMTASNQMVLAIFYVVTYMRHTSNIENAIDFASQHLTGPLALDFKKVLWDVETEKYESVKESLEIYLNNWKQSNNEFVESMHLIESSLLESTESRRLFTLDRALDNMLSGTYEKMLHFAHNLQAPLTILHMLGIIMPILGLVILPLVVSLMEGVKWYYIATLYNIILPIAIYLFGKEILSTRPTGYGDVDITEYNPEYKKFKKLRMNFFGKVVFVNPIYLCVFIFLILFIIGLSPVLLKGTMVVDGEIIKDICINKNWGAYNPMLQVNAKQQALFCFFEYRESSSFVGQVIGPFGLVAGLLSLLITLAFGIPIGIYYRIKSRNIIKIRDSAKKLEDEFASGLFQLGNRMADGLPAEVAFGKVAETLQDTATGTFFEKVSSNISKLGMSLKAAIFDKRVGIASQYPSAVIQSSMKVLVESARKGPKVAANALVNVSRYIKEIHSVNERLRDLMADIISNLKTQVKFLTPAIAAVVVGITSMITFILGRLTQLNQTQGLAEAGGVAQLFAGDGIPTFFFQIIVGLYVTQLVYILTILGNSIENGVDKLNEEYLIGENMIKSTLTYVITTGIVMILFSLLAGLILSRGIGG